MPLQPEQEQKQGESMPSEQPRRPPRPSLSKHASPVPSSQRDSQTQSPIYNIDALLAPLANYNEGVCRENPTSFQCLELKRKAGAELLAGFVQDEKYNALENYFTEQNKKLWGKVYECFKSAKDFDSAIKISINLLLSENHIVYRSLEDPTYNKESRAQLGEIKEIFKPSSDRPAEAVIERCFRLFQRYIFFNDARKHELHAQGALGNQSEGPP